MKKRVDHTVALSRQAVALFQDLPRTGDRVFGDLGDEALRDALAAVMAQAGREWDDRQTGKVVVPHGLRASFATCAGEYRLRGRADRRGASARGVQRGAASVPARRQGGTAARDDAALGGSPRRIEKGGC